MNIITTAILPNRQQFATKANTSHELNLEAICVFVATGFFMGSDTYWKDQICLLPGHKHTLDADGVLIESKRYFDWHYSPKHITFEAAVEEYVALLKDITKSQVGDQQVILPLSGGLDSRSQALIFKDLDNPVHSYSYSFKNGFAEHAISAKIAKACGFTFSPFIVPKGYLWNNIDELARINGCYSEFTHPRQMAFLPEFKQMNGVFSLGHWGDVLYERGAPEGTNESDILPLLFKKMIKPKGLELAESLWQLWGLEGDFKAYLTGRIEDALSKIKIENISARVRAYKTENWAHRWTTTNLSVFEAAHPITLPYYDNRMCEFICTIPEEFLADRKMQIAHLKKDKVLSSITWQDQIPFNIQNYHYNKSPYNLPYRILEKMHRESRNLIGKRHVLRNWELQFLGDNNDTQLKNRLFDKDFNQWIPEHIVHSVYDHFRNEDAINYSHPLSMLLTLSLWNKHHKNETDS